MAKNVLTGSPVQPTGKNVSSSDFDAAVAKQVKARLEKILGGKRSSSKRKDEFTGRDIKESTRISNQLKEISEDTKDAAAELNSLLKKNMQLYAIMTSDEKKLRLVAKQRANQTNLQYQLELAQQRGKIKKLLEEKTYEAELMDLAREKRDLLDNTLKTELEQFEIKEKLTTEEAEEYAKKLLDAGKLIQSQEKLNELYKELLENSPYIKSRDAIKSFVDHMDAVTKNVKVAGALFGASIVDKATELLKSSEEIREQMGLTGNDTMRVAGYLGKAQVASLLTGIHQKTIAAATHSIMEATKSTDSLNTKSIVKVAKMADKYGMMTDEAASLYNNIMLTNNKNIELTNNSIEYGKNLAAASHVPIGILMKDVASNTQLFAASAKEGGKNLFDAASTAAQLQISLDDMSQISTGLLDIESSLAGERKISAMFGAQLNFEKAREMAYNDDIQGAHREIVRQLSQELNWNKLTGFERNQIAQAMNTNVEVLNKAIQNEAELNKLKTEEGKITTQIYNAAKGVLVTGKEWGAAIASTVNFTGSLLSNWKEIGPLVGKVGTKIGGIFSKKGETSWLGKMSGKIKGWFTKDKIEETKKDTETVTETKTPGINPIAKFFQDFKTVTERDIIRGGMAMVIMAGALALVGSAMKVYTQVPFPAFMEGLVALGALTTSTVLIGKVGNNIIKGAAAMAIIGGAMIPFGVGMMLLAKVPYQNIIAASGAIIALSGAAVVLGAAKAAALPGAAVLGILGVAMLGFGAGIKLMADGMVTMAPVLTQIVPLVGQLALLSAGMFAIGAGFGAMGVGLMPLAAGLAMVSPFLPVLAALNTLSTPKPKGKEAKSTESSKGKEAKSTESSKDIIDRLDTIIDLFHKGGNVYLDEKAIGRWLGGHHATVSAIENRR